MKLNYFCLDPSQFGQDMLPTDPKVISGVPNENRSVMFGTFLGISTVILGTKLVNLSPLQSK